MERNGISSELSLQELSRALAATNDSDLIENFLRSLLTEYEIDEGNQAVGTCQTY